MHDSAYDEFLTRRSFVSRAARCLLGVSVLPATSLLAESSGKRSAKHVIYLFMNGAMSQLDTLDPKPGVEEQGPTGSIQTSQAGVQLSEHFPNLAKQMNKVALIRSMTTQTGAHRPATYLMRTSYREIASIRHPGLGAWIQRLDGRLNSSLPGNVVIGGDNQHPLAGFMDAKYAPVPIGDPAAGLENTTQPKYLSDSQFAQRMSLAQKFDKEFQAKFQHRDVRTYTQLYREAVNLLKSKDLDVFDIGRETDEVRQQYGENRIGQGCLLARRLIENKVRFVEVSFNGWDDHQLIFENLPTRAQELDQALATLLQDLQDRGLLDQTLVVLTTEFGRKPSINENTGRDHHPGAFSSLLAGGGIRGGQVWGGTDEIAYSVEYDNVEPADFNATIAYALGLRLDETIYSPAGRPFTVARGGTPISALF